MQHGGTIQAQTRVSGAYIFYPEFLCVHIAIITSALRVLRATAITARFPILRGEKCVFDGRSVVADQVETRVSEIMESLVLPANWQATLQEMLNTQKDELDPQKETMRVKGEMRRIREAFKKGLYENDEHSFWCEIESLQEKLSSLEQLTPHEFREAGHVLAGLKEAWHIATLEERRELCQIILKQVSYDFERGVITRILPNPEYEVLFRLASNSETIEELDHQS